MELEDIELLRDYIANESEPAFRTLVERHVDMVYATALRQVQDAHLAEEVTQAVFIALAKKAQSLSPQTILAGWLFRAAQFAGAKAKRTEARRKHWEQQAAQMEPIASDGESAWDQIAPHLNDALNELKEPDRDAIILRFFESKSIAQVGSALGTKESATKMRIARALEQLREIFQARGIVLPGALLLAALSTQAAPAAPIGLAASIATSALLKQTAIPILTKGTLLLMTWNTQKTTIAALIVLLLLSGTTNGILIYALNHRQQPAREIAVRTENTPPPAVDVVLGEGQGDQLRPVRTRTRGTLRIVNADGEVVTTNEGNPLVVVDGNGTNTLSITPAGGGPRRVMNYRATASPARTPGGAGIGGPPRGIAPVPTTPAPAPQ
jgi:RNA polymerase sigma factor (sigma-70 family)